jgi:hypothetical protein
LFFLRRRGTFLSQSVSKVQGATFFRNLRGLAFFRLLFAQNTRMQWKNYTMMYCHCKKINPSNHSRYMSNGHVTSPSGMNNGISLKRGEEIWAPPERPNYAAPPSRNFSDVSCKVHILEIELYQ